MVWELGLPTPGPRPGGRELRRGAAAGKAGGM